MAGEIYGNLRTEFSAFEDPGGDPCFVVLMEIAKRTRKRIYIESIKMEILMAQDWKLNAAKEQLEWAIRLFLDHQSYFCAITLAGSAEEILGKSLNQSDRSLEILKNTLSTEFNMTPKEVADHLNCSKNAVKHGNDEIKADYEWDTWAISLILRALVNLTNLGSPLPENAPRFHQWIYQNRSEVKS